ncbi:rhomboid family intramembrane serine protease [Actinocrispum wychmicini]|uniref:Membrane associated rhomboid family serine protease n=1 Tax=Actinocrispum wychmicini TaxID=1213861 RepID=A0A4R2JXP0_9PSEU|nr:rhomboid family intramembrane serine protease [Actinocrispum wychmicini]TCO64644.1 membrane associated rhomboid family serine protease [Actinocrispum wychmicini]
METCVRHPDRPTGVRCARCERPACPECLREAPVGYQCVDCVQEGQRTQRRPVTIAGAELGSRLVVVPVIVVINIAVFAFNAYQAQSISHNELSQSFVDWVLAPVLVQNGEWWRLVTSGFLHIGFTHLALNMVSLWIIGRELELVFGRLRFLTLYLVSLLGGSAAVYILSASGAAGASGAIYGLMGALLVTVIRLKLPLGQVIAVIVLNLALSFSGLLAISWEAHIGGLVTGAAVGVGFLYPPARIRNQVQTATVIGVLVVLVGLMAGLGSLQVVDL